MLRNFENDYLKKTRLTGRSSIIRRTSNNTDQKNVAYGLRAIQWMQEQVDSPITINKIISNLEKLGNHFYQHYNSINYRKL